MSARRRRLFSLALPRAGDIFSQNPTSASPGYGFNEGNPDDNGGPDVPPVIAGIQTQDGQNIEDQGGDIIQAANQ